MNILSPSVFLPFLAMIMIFFFSIDDLMVYLMNWAAMLL